MDKETRTIDQQDYKLLGGGNAGWRATLPTSAQCPLCHWNISFRENPGYEQEHYFCAHCHTEWKEAYLLQAINYDELGGFGLVEPTYYPEITEHYD